MANTLTPIFRVSYPNVFKPRKNELNGKDEYTLVALFPKNADLSSLKKAVQQAVEARWGTDKNKWPANLKTPFKNQGDKGKDVNGKKVLPAGYEDGAILINLKSEQRPGLVDQSLQDIIDPSQFYAGCWARATISVYSYDNKGNRGVAFGLSNLQKVKDGDPLGGKLKPQDDFAPIEDASGGSAEDLF